jgi:hypothetical protein
MTDQSATPAVTLPEIMTANTYFWSPGGSASMRRHNEDRRNNEVARFLESHGFTLIQPHTWRRAGVEVYFNYSEGCSHVYRTMKITRDGKKSNITAIIKLLSSESLPENSTEGR